jgi:hypothetical protein
MLVGGLKMIRILSAFTILALAASPVFAEGKHKGWGEDSTSTSTQGNSGKTNPNANPENEGQTTTTTTTEGPKGQLKQDNFDCNNCSTTTETDLPGKNR